MFQMSSLNLLWRITRIIPDEPIPELFRVAAYGSRLRRLLLEAIEDGIEELVESFVSFHGHKYTEALIRMQ